MIGATTFTKVPGEYDHVARASADVEALRRAHATPITRDEATRMLHRLAAQHLPAADALSLVIRWGTRRGRGGRMAPRKRVLRTYVDGSPVLHWRTGKPRYRVAQTGPSVPFVSLPSTLMPAPGLVEATRVTRSGRRYSTMCLRVGLVLHEFAHVMNARDGHGPAFVARLDSLVAAWATEHTSAIAAGAEERPCFSS